MIMRTIRTGNITQWPRHCIKCLKPWVRYPVPHNAFERMHRHAHTHSHSPTYNMSALRTLLPNFSGKKFLKAPHPYTPMQLSKNRAIVLLRGPHLETSFKGHHPIFPSLTLNRAWLAYNEESMS